MFELGKKIQAQVTYSNEVIYVLFGGESRSKDNSKDLGRGDPFNAGKQRRNGSIRKAWTMKNYFLGFEGVEFELLVLDHWRMWENSTSNVVGEFCGTSKVVSSAYLRITLTGERGLRSFVIVAITLSKCQTTLIVFGTNLTYCQLDDIIIANAYTFVSQNAQK